MAQALVGEQLAACVNRVRSIQSVYRWQGKVEQNDEELLIIKTRRQLFPALEKRVKELHSYSVPEIIGLPIIEGSADYLDLAARAGAGASRRRTKISARLERSRPAE